MLRVTVTSPMNRGLKADQIHTPITDEKVTVTSPMNRGLKERFARFDPKTVCRVTVTSPMNRGLKVIAVNDGIALIRLLQLLPR